MENKIKRIDIREFREKGYLQELNRRFLHPLGLALEISIDDIGNEKLSGIWDYRDDKEGIYYNISNSDLERKITFNDRKSFIDAELENRCKNRREALGFDIEPLDQYIQKQNKTSEIKTLIDGLDDILIHLEDQLHGDQGENITIARSKLQKIKELSTFEKQ